MPTIQSRIIRELAKIVIAAIATLFLSPTEFPLQWNEVIYPQSVLINGVLTSCAMITCYPERALNEANIDIDTIFWFIVVFSALTVIPLAYSKLRKRKAGGQSP